MKSINFFDTRVCTTNFLEKIPNDISMNCIIGLLDEKQLLIISLVNKQFCQLAQDNSIWRIFKANRNIIATAGPLAEYDSEKKLVLKTIQRFLQTFGPVYQILKLKNIESSMRTQFELTDSQDDLNNYINHRDNLRYFEGLETEEQRLALPKILPKEYFEAENFLMSELNEEIKKIECKEGLIDYLNCEMTTNESLTDYNLVKKFIELGAYPFLDVIDAAKNFGASNDIIQLLYSKKFTEDAKLYFSNDLMKEIEPKIVEAFSTYEENKIILNDEKIIFKDVENQDIYDMLIFKLNDYFRLQCQECKINLEVKKFRWKKLP